MTIVIFLLVLGLVVFVHELGHFLMAKATGVKVEEFAFGFPPRLFAFKRQGTEYAINLVPFGGYVKMLGEDQASKDTHSFCRQAPPRRLIIVIAGVLMNYFLAIFFLWIGFMIGMSPITLDAQKLPGAKQTKIGVVEVTKDSAASNAGIQPGDLIVGFSSTDEFQKFTLSHRGETVSFNVQREDKEISAMALLSQDPAAPLGVMIVNITKVKMGPGQALVAAVKDSWGFVRAVTVFLGSFISQLFQGRLAVEVAGPVGMYQITGQAVKLGAVYVIQWVAILSLNLGLINALPFPALDGGRAIFIILEGVFGRRILKFEIENALHILGFALLLILMAAVTYREIATIVVSRWGS